MLSKHNHIAIAQEKILENVQAATFNLGELPPIKINVTAPVVNDNDEIIGSITVDDVVDVIEEEREEDILKLGGVGQTDLYSAVVITTRLRFSWLLVNLLTAIIASFVISFFQTSIEKVVAAIEAPANQPLSRRPARK